MIYSSALILFLEESLSQHIYLVSDVKLAQVENDNLMFCVSFFHLGPQSKANFENVGEEGATRAPPFQPFDNEDSACEDFDGCLGQPGKRRRLTASQVQFLEKNFEVENKLEPERKVQLAKELGLPPRQVAIWFQNRRARSKNQRLGKDYDSLKAVYDKLKDDYDNLLKEKQVLQNEVVINLYATFLRSPL